jgi:hypothetical protein
MLCDSFLLRQEKDKLDWARVDDVHEFNLTSDEMTGEPDSNKYGEVVEGRFSGCVNASHS